MVLDLGMTSVQSHIINTLVMPRNPLWPFYQIYNILLIWLCFDAQGELSCNSMLNMLTCGSSVTARHDWTSDNLGQS